MALPFVRKPYVPQKKKNEHLLNEEIKHVEIRVVMDGVEPRIMKCSDALREAKELGMDLIEIAGNQNPAVCRIADYKKFMYDKKKKEKDNAKKNEHSEVKELRFTPTTDEHDVAFKTKHAIHWLTNGDKVKAFVFFKGRSIMYKNQGEMLLLKLAESLKDFGRIEQLPQMEGKTMHMMIVPKKK